MAELSSSSKCWGNSPTNQTYIRATVTLRAPEVSNFFKTLSIFLTTGADTSRSSVIIRTFIFPMTSSLCAPGAAFCSSLSSVLTYQSILSLPEPNLSVKSTALPTSTSL
jgi:hypothetical protein